MKENIKVGIVFLIVILLDIITVIILLGIFQLKGDFEKYLTGLISTVIYFLIASVYLNMEEQN